MKEILSRQISDLLLEREEDFKNEFKKELKLELEKQHKIITEKVIEQVKAENKRLTKYITIKREEDKKKSFFSRLI